MIKIIKDADLTVCHVFIYADEDLTGSRLAWGLVPTTADFSGDLDTLLESAPVHKTPDEEGNTEGVSITETNADTHEWTVTVVVGHADTHEVPLGYYYALLRIVTPTEETALAIRKEKMKVVA